MRASSPDRTPPPFINLCGDYRWLRAGYWALVDAELNDVLSRPSFLEAATAQNAAACLLAARASGIRTVEWRIARKAADVEPPCLLVPVAGLTDATYACHSVRSAPSQWRRASQNGTRPVLVARLEGQLRVIKTIVGVTTSEQYALAWDVWRALGIPLARVWYVESSEGPLFLGLDPLRLHELTDRELRLLEEVSQRPMSPS